MYAEHLPTPRQLLVPVVVLIVGWCLAVGAGPAFASHVSCGDIITADTTLDSDLVNCPNHGIVIAADGVTLDLNGHLVDGDGTQLPAAISGWGHVISGCSTTAMMGVTVMHGSVREFAAGVLFGTATGRARNNRMLGVSATRNQFTGIGIFSQVGGLVRNSSGVGSLDGDGVGLALADSHHVRIVNNSFRPTPITADHTLVERSRRNLIRGNVFSRNADEGILMEGGARFRVTGNRLVRNGGGITLGPGNQPW